MTLIDAAQRELITGELSSNLFIEAGAGAGKTHLLVERIVAVVEAGTPMSAVAAITFTEAAAAELRQRVRAALEDRPDSATARSALEQLDEAALCTLHAFAQRLLRRHPLDVDLPPVFEVLDEVRSQLDAEARHRRLWRALLDDPDELPLALRALTRHWTEDQVRSLARHFDDNWDLLDRVPTFDEPLREIELGPLLEARTRLGELRPICTDDDDKLAIKADQTRDWIDALVAAADDVTRVALLGDPPPRPGRSGRADNWAGRKADCAAVMNELGERVAEQMEQLDDQLVRWVSARVASASAQAADERRRAGTLEYHDLLVLARRLLREHLPARRELGERYRVLLLDEFQDTDPLQIELAVLLVGEDGGHWTEAAVESGRLTVVGDPKQSIYRFRRADIGVYKQAGRAAFVDESPVLSVNFRSVPGVVEVVNRVFEPLLGSAGSDDESQPGYSPMVPRRPGGSGPAVRLLGGPVEDPTVRAATLREIEAALVADALLGAADEGWMITDPATGRDRPCRFDDMAVLLPARTSLPQLLAALDERGVPHRLEAATLALARDEVRQVVAVARAIEHPEDPVAVVAALRSDLLACGDDDLVRWHQAGGSWCPLDPPPSGGEGVPEPVAAAMAWLADEHRGRHEQSPADLLERIVRTRGAFEAALGRARWTDAWRSIRFLLERARAFCDAGRGGLGELLDWIDLSSAEGNRVAEPLLDETDDEAVRILTIHAAKGREFPLVVVAGMSTQLAHPPRGVSVLWPPEGGGPEVRLSGGLASAGHQDRAVAEQYMSEAERKRLLYVACTRARDHLVISGVHKPTGKDSYARVLYRAIVDAGLIPPDAEPDAPADGELPEPRVMRWQPPRAPSVSPAVVVTESASLGPDDLASWTERREAALARRGPTAARLPSELGPTEPGRPPERPTHVGAAGDDLPEASRRAEWGGTALGRAVHAVMASVDLAAPGELSARCRQAAAVEGCADQADRVVELVGSLLRTPTVREAARRRHRREMHLAAPIAGVLVEGYIDLLVELDDGLLVVDFKTDALVEGLDAVVATYRSQMAAYAELVERTTGRTVMGARLLVARSPEAVELEVSELDRARARLAAGLIGSAQS